MSKKSNKNQKKQNTIPARQITSTITKSMFYSDIPTPDISNPYTYIDTLKPEHADIFNQAANYIDNFIGTQTLGADTRRRSAVDFLRRAAKQQRAGEIAFIQNEIDKMKKMTENASFKELQKKILIVEKDIENLKNSSFDYFTFVKDLNLIISETDTFIARLETLKANFLKQNSERGLLENIDTEYLQLLKILRGENKSIEQEKMSYENTCATFIANFVQKHKNELAEALTSDQQFSAWLLKTSIAFRIFLEKEHTERRKNTLEQYNKTKDSLEKDFNNFIQQYYNNQSFSKEELNILDEIAKNMSFIKASENTTKRETVKLPSLQESNLQKDYSIAFTSDFSSSAIAERMGIIVPTIFQKFMQMGGSGMGNDSISMVLTLLVSDPNYNDQFDKVSSTMSNLNKAWTDFSKIRDDRKHFQSSNKTMNDTVEKELKNLNKTLNGLDELSHAFIIHETDKYYLSMEKGYEVGWRTHLQGFHGRTIAILNYIDMLGNLALDFNIGNLNEMKFFALNLANGSPGAGHANVLEEVFTYAAGMIMFDDVAVAVKEATGQLEFSNVSNIHLYKLEELYFPSSYILEQTADYLENCPVDVNNAATAHIEIGDNIYYPEYQYLESNTDIKKSLSSFSNKTPSERWNIMKNYAASHTKVSIHFFLNFAKFISQIPH